MYFNLQQFTLPDFGLMTAADKLKLDGINSITYLTTAAAAETYATKAEVRQYIRQVLESDTGYVFVDGTGSEVAVIPIEPVEKSSPELTLSLVAGMIQTGATLIQDGSNYTVKIDTNVYDYWNPLVLNASYSGDGDLSATGGTVEGGNVAITPEHGKRVTVSVGESREYESETATVEIRLLESGGSVFANPDTLNIPLGQSGVSLITVNTNNGYDYELTLEADASLNAVLDGDRVTLTPTATGFYSCTVRANNFTSVSITVIAQ